MKKTIVTLTLTLMCIIGVLAQNLSTNAIAKTERKSGFSLFESNAQAMTPTNAVLEIKQDDPNRAIMYKTVPIIQRDSSQSSITNRIKGNVYIVPDTNMTTRTP